MSFCTNWGEQKVVEFSEGGGGGAEHKPGSRDNNDSAIKQHAELTGHDIHPSHVAIDGKACSWSLHSTLTTIAVNERQPFPKAYLPLIASRRDLDRFFLEKSFKLFTAILL